MNDELWEFDVGWTTERPIVVDQYRSRVQVLTDSYSDAIFLAVAMIDRGACEMVTSTNLVV